MGYFVILLKYDSHAVVKKYSSGVERVIPCEHN